tara:strand:+ start:573 stop:1457 length:885 start_codon:yes stop_codon:yes gene_type:complete
MSANRLCCLTKSDRAFYEENGYLLIEGAISAVWLNRLRDATDRLVDRARAMTVPDSDIDLEPSHTPNAPRIRRLTQPVALDPVFWEFASESIIVDVAADLVGPNVKFHHSKLNFKWASGGEEVKWHQDIPFYPHTNCSPLTVGVYLGNVGPEQAPMAIVPGSHHGPIFSHYNDKDEWAGFISSKDLGQIDLDSAVPLMGPEGSVTVHSCRVVHGSVPNHSKTSRPLLLNAYSSSDAFPYTAHSTPRPQVGTIVRGEQARFARFDGEKCPIPPDWSKTGYRSIFAAQQDEDHAKR